MRGAGIFILIFLAVTLGSAAEHEAEHEKLLEPMIVDLDSMTVVGIQTLFSMKCNLIPVLWERFGPRMQEIKSVARDNIAVEVSYDIHGEADDQTFFVLAGMIVNSIEDIPEGMTYKYVPAHRYALFTHYGPISQIYDTYDWIYNKFLPRAAYEVDEKACTIEWYDERFKMEAPDSEYDIYVPVKEREQ